MEEEICVQFGCGLSCPTGWFNYDASPTLRLQKIPLIGRLLTRGRVTFPKAVLYGDILKGLPHPNDSVDKIYCSHVLEHLSLHDFRRALLEVKRCLKPGGEFRLVMPDLRVYAEEYLNSTHPDASIKFMHRTMLGIRLRERGILSSLINSLGNHHHLWLWDESSTKQELAALDFQEISAFTFSPDESSKFSLVQEKGRFNDAVAIKCTKSLL